MEHLAAKTLGLNAIGVANLSTDKPLVFEPYEKSRDLGGFILIDKISNATVAAGMLHFALRRSQQRALAGARHRSRGACALEASASAAAVVHGLERLRKIQHRQSRAERSSMRSASTASCSTATISATASTRIWDSPTRIASRTSAASAKSPG